MRFSFLLLPFVYALPVFSQEATITDISQIPASTNLPPCISRYPRVIILNLRYTNCWQKVPVEVANCLCSTSTNSALFYGSLSTIASANCRSRSEIDLSSVMDVFSSYCRLAGNAQVITASLGGMHTTTGKLPTCLVF